MTLSKSLKEIIWPFLTKFVLGTLMKTGCQRELVPAGKRQLCCLKPIFRLVFASFHSSHKFFYQVFAVRSQYFFSLRLVFANFLAFINIFLFLYKSNEWFFLKFYNRVISRIMIKKMLMTQTMTMIILIWIWCKVGP